LPTTELDPKAMTKVGEIIESATDQCIAQSYELDTAPPLGSLVRVIREDGTIIYGVVSTIETRPLDPGRRPIARGRDATSLKEIHQQHPQLKELFRTEFGLKVLGYEANALHYYLPPLPPEVHQLVYACDPEQLLHFSQRLGFLPLLLGGPDSDEVAGAFLRTAARARGADGAAFLVQAGKSIVNLLKGDAPRLNALLARLR